MFRIALVNMPFSSVEIPSIALSQLQAVVARQLGARVSVEISYPSHDMALLLGLSDYAAVCDESSSSGLGDWLFQRLAFPRMPDKADLTAGDMEILSRAGVDSVRPGIEALATSTLKLMRKGMTSVRNILFLQRCLLYDIHPGWNLLVGFPGEGEEVFQKYVDDLPRLAHLPPPITVHPVRFDRYSPYFTQAREYGLELAPFDFYSMIYPFPPESLERLAYYFTDRNIDAPYFLAAASWIALLRRQQSAWTAAWTAGRPPELCFEHPGSARIRDSRTGREVIHDVGPAGRQALEALAEPATFADLGKLPAASNLDWESELARLRNLGLLFEDGQRLISLVLPHPTPAERLRRRYLSEAPAVTAPAPVRSARRVRPRTAQEQIQ